MSRPPFHSFRSMLLTAVVSMAALISGATTVGASPLISGTTYNLANHPDGNQAPPFYGLRLDGLLGDTSEVWTFDFDHANSGMFLVWDEVAATLDIFGQSFGGQDIGASYAVGTTSVWDISFRYENVQDLGGSLKVSAAGGPNGSGTIANTSTNSDLPTLEAYALIDYGSPDTFNLATGHRGVADLSGWGWLNHSGAPNGIGQHVYSSDWLFTIGDPERVPEPTLGAMLAGGLLLGALVGRRR